MRIHNGWRQGLTCAVWLAASAVASYTLMAYDFAPGRLGARQERWPAETALTRAAGAPTVVAFLHPRCVCSVATVRQLTRALHAHHDAALVVAAYVPPPPAPQDWWVDNAYLRTLQASVPGARIVYDADGVEARRFGAFTSGTILVYDTQGREVFRGGITDRRGGDQENPGLARLTTVLQGRHTALSGEPTPVFGCPIVAPSGPTATQESGAS